MHLRFSDLDNTVIADQSLDYIPKSETQRRILEDSGMSFNGQVKHIMDQLVSMLGTTTSTGANGSYDYIVLEEHGKVVGFVVRELEWRQLSRYSTRCTQATGLVPNGNEEIVTVVDLDCGANHSTIEGKMVVVVLPLHFYAAGGHHASKIPTGTYVVSLCDEQFNSCSSLATDNWYDDDD